MPLHPHIRSALQTAAGLPPLETQPLAQARAQAKARYASVIAAPAIGAARDLSIPGLAGAIGARVYTPEGPGPFPLLVFFHGSGFVLLDLDTHDLICRQLCAGARCVVVSVDYRLAPEHPFPAAPDDCLAATRWAAAHAAELGGDAARIALAGDSAGGCLAAVTALRIRDEGGPPICAQLLFYPVTDYPAPLTSTHREFATGYGLTLSCLEWYWSNYLPDPALADNPLASPLRARSFERVPPALILSAEYDVLRDEGERYCERLQQDGVRAERYRCLGMNHGFLKYAGILDEASAAMRRATAWLQSVQSNQASGAGDNGSVGRCVG